MSGWIKKHRKMLEWEWYSDLKTRALFDHCLLLANFEDCKWRGIDIKKGSFISSLANLSQSSGLTIRELRTSLSRLKSTGEMTSQSTSEYTMFTVLKYELYQSNDTPNDKPKTRKRQANDKPATTDKEGKEIKEDYNIVDAIYLLYPSKCPNRETSTGKTAKDKDKIKTLLQTISPEQLTATVTRYVNECRRDNAYMKNFGTFLNNLPDYSNAGEERPNITRDVWHVAKHVPAEMKRLCEKYNLTEQQFIDLHK